MSLSGLLKKFFLTTKGTKTTYAKASAVEKGTKYTKLKVHVSS